MPLLPIGECHDHDQTHYDRHVLALWRLWADLESVQARAAVAKTAMVNALKRGSMWRAALMGRVSYTLHRLGGHNVEWRTVPTDLPICTGDILCHSCAQVLWCRAYDPWGFGARHRGLAPPDHWGRARRAVPRGSLFEALDHVLRLTEQFPAGNSRECLRREVCELIEASSSRARRASLRHLMDDLGGLQRRHVDDASLVVTEELLGTLWRDVIPLLEYGRGR